MEDKLAIDQKTFKPFTPSYLLAGSKTVQVIRGLSGTFLKEYSISFPTLPRFFRLWPCCSLVIDVFQSFGNFGFSKIETFKFSSTERLK